MRQKGETERDWPVKTCSKCGCKIRLVKTREGWKPYESKTFRPHKCGDALDYSVPLFNPRKNPFEK